MPYRKPRTRKRVPRRRARKYGSKKMAMYKTPTFARVPAAGFPDRMFTKLKYVDQIAVTTSGSSYANHIFRANSLYYPDYTYTGHQPLFFDQYAAVYNQYRVFAVKQILDIDNASTSNTLNCTVLHATSPTAFTSTRTMLEQTGSAVTRSASTGRQQPVRLKYFIKTSQVFGLTKKEEMDNDYSGLVTANPTKIWYLHNHYEAVDGLSNISFNALIRLTFYCEFFDRKDVAAS